MDACTKAKYQMDTDLYLNRVSYRTQKLKYGAGIEQNNSALRSTYHQAQWAGLFP